MFRLYMGTEFTGDCVALVVETGERSQMGKIFQPMADADPERSPLQKMVDRLIFVLAMLSIGASVLNAAVCIPTGRGVDPSSTDHQALVCVLNSIALTVAAVPENLPVALVIALAAIIKNLARRGVIVKSLPAGEELSRLNYVFSDKTGTLTKNEMTTRAVVTSQGYVALSLNNNNDSGGNAGVGDEFVPPAGTTNHPWLETQRKYGWQIAFAFWQPRRKTIFVPTRPEMPVSRRTLPTMIWLSNASIWNQLHPKPKWLELL
jgi:P-type Ca2+ transporter type 2C